MVQRAVCVNSVIYKTSRCLFLVSASSRRVMQREYDAETPALLISVIFQSCVFQFFSHALLSVIFLSCILQPFTFVHYIPVLHFPPPIFHCPSFHFPLLHFSAPHDQTLVLSTVFQGWPVQVLEYCSNAAVLVVVGCHESCCTPIDSLACPCPSVDADPRWHHYIFHNRSDKGEVGCLLYLLRR